MAKKKKAKKKPQKKILSEAINHHVVDLDPGVFKEVCGRLMMFIEFDPSLVDGSGDPAPGAEARGLGEPCRRIAEADAHAVPPPKPTRLQMLVNDLKGNHPGLDLEAQFLADGEFPFVGDLVFHVQSA